MSGVPSRAAVIRSIIAKDFRELFRDKLWMTLGPLTLLLFTAIYILLPDEVDSTVTVGVHPSMLAELAGEMGLTGIELVPFDDPDTLEAMVLSGEADGHPAPVAGISLSSNLFQPGGGGSASVTVYLGEGVPSYLRYALSSGILEASLAISSIVSGDDPLSQLPVTLPDLHSVIAGEATSLTGFPVKQLLRPLMVMALLMMESLALAGLVSLEIWHRTAAAVLVTPARTGDLLTAKWLTGILLAVVQVVLFLLVTGLPWSTLPLVAILVVLGAMMMSSVGMITGAAGKDFIGTLFLGMVFIIPMMLPAIGLLFPGRPSLFMSLLPTTGLVRSLAAVMGSGAGWLDVLPETGAILAWDALLFITAFLVLRRRVVSL